MRRWITIFLLALLPLQSFWVAAAALCQHGQDASAQHFGHHAHEHESAAPAAASPDTANPASPSETASTIDADCAVCHITCTKPVVSETPVLWACSCTSALFAGVRTPPIASPLPNPIERPKWHRAA